MSGTRIFVNDLVRISDEGHVGNYGGSGKVLAVKYIEDELWYVVKYVEGGSHGDWGTFEFPADRVAFLGGLNRPDRNPTEVADEPTTETLPVNSEARKGIPITTGVLDYFPAALAYVAKVSKAGNDKHNPGEPLNWARGKSTDQADAIGRHLIDRGGFDPDTKLRHSGELAWRALALLQLELEEAGEAPLARGARQ